jgi:TetR/AcrR family fatty acid metabolism transcriptional regulator
MFAEAKERGEMREELDPVLCGAFLFGSIELGLTSFVLGFIDPENEEALQHARRQLSESFLNGVLTLGRERQTAEDLRSSRIT